MKVNFNFSPKLNAQHLQNKNVYRINTLLRNIRTFTKNNPDYQSDIKIIDLEQKLNTLKRNFDEADMLFCESTFASIEYAANIKTRNLPIYSTQMMIV